MRGNNLVPLDLEIEATCRKKTATRKKREQLEVQSNQEEGGLLSSKLPAPSFATSPHPFSKECIMAKDHP